MSDLQPINANGWHIADNKSIYEPARGNNFEFIVHGIDNILRAGVLEPDAQESDYIQNGQEILRLGLNKAFAPHFKQSEVVISKGNTKTYFAGPIEYESGTIEVNDFIGASGKSVLLAWQRLSGDSRTGAVGHASEYKKDCDLLEYSPDYKTLVRSWKLIGCWVTAISESDWDNENPGKKTVTATIRYDRAYIE